MSYGDRAIDIDTIKELLVSLHVNWLLLQEFSGAYGLSNSLLSDKIVVQVSEGSVLDNEQLHIEGVEIIT